MRFRPSHRPTGASHAPAPSKRRTRIERHPTGPRVYGAGLRVHHGLVGLLAVAFLPGRWRMLGAVALTHDIRDFPFTDRSNH